MTIERVKLERSKVLMNVYRCFSQQEWVYHKNNKYSSSVRPHRIENFKIQALAIAIALCVDVLLFYSAIRNLFFSFAFSAPEF